MRNWEKSARLLPVPHPLCIHHGSSILHSTKSKRRRRPSGGRQIDPLLRQEPVYGTYYLVRLPITCRLPQAGKERERERERKSISPLVRLRSSLVAPSGCVSWKHAAAVLGDGFLLLLPLAVVLLLRAGFRSAEAAGRVGRAFSPCCDHRAAASSSPRRRQKQQRCHRPRLLAPPARAGDDSNSSSSSHHNNNNKNTNTNADERDEGDEGDGPSRHGQG
jgi:hypothetical protein